ncbi:ABC-2 type transport system ATP-binding protein [Glaciihabitans tibetensis]|uniref:ABC-2 type transport system ATP-binding protein n=1 Tax=Glaciihabitans tibetensis TaxID=1266600 RepID=A0A2T0VB17_9MICO|nr:ATP-binding cassette domain-containing protein [Glaciihabitans tibetensis]PRY67237.1 ABC-2 type transport system ATP-binding protein [Glaciihabitans tibetensis]
MNPPTNTQTDTQTETRPTETVIFAEGLSKQFQVKRERVDAVTGLDLEVRRGELVAFLGPNGAGKSTSLRMLTTLLTPSSGTATICGHSVLADPASVRRRIGYIGQGNSGSYGQRVRDEMMSQGAFYGMSRAATAKRTAELLDSLELAPLAKRTVMSLSGGQKRRLDIALGLIHSPEVLFLDEPSTGLDPQSRAHLWQHILDLRRDHGTTIFVTTHYLDEADQFAERVMVMDHGRVIADDTADALKTTLAGDVITVGFSSEADATAARTVIGEVTGAETSADPGSATTAPPVTALSVTVQSGDRLLPRLLHGLDAAGVPAVSATLRQPTLDDVFLSLTGRSLREESAGTGSAGAPKLTPTESESLV